MEQRPLVLVPTERERGLIEPVLEAACGGQVHLAVCGFGPVVAAARAARLIAEHRPTQVLLVGIAGRFADRLTIGAAYSFARVACHGIGAGSGDAFIPAEPLGWPQWPGEGVDSALRIGDTLPCSSGGPAAAPRAGLLLSACSASASEADVSARLRLFPDAVAEDMEGFAVAAACSLGGVPLDIVRGISNTAGDRDLSHWQIDTACRAAAALAATIFGGRS